METIESSYQRGVPALVSYEPWPLEGHSKWTVLSDTAAGDYDSVIRSAAQAVATLEQPILIRFGHEMDINELYPWSGRNPAKYIAAYQHVVSLFEQEGATNVLWVWSPGGFIDADRYYPGDAFVDYIGITILEYSGWERDGGYLEPRPITELINEKYQLFHRLGKPIIISELGVDLPDDLKAQAIKDVINSLPSFPRIRAVVYFNSRNPVTPLMDEQPTWSLTDAERELLIDSLARSRWIESPVGKK